MNTSESIKNWSIAFKRAQEATPTPLKTKGNPAFKKNGKDLPYAGLDDCLDAVLPWLNAHGFIIVQPPFGGTLVTRIVHVESGEWLEGEFPIFGETPQQLGSSLTYARRYALTSLLCVVADVDDDGNAAQAKTQPKPQVAASINAQAPKYPGSGQYLATLNMTASEVEGFKADCKANGLEWGAVALRAKDFGVDNGQALVAFIHIVHESNPNQGAE